MTLHQIAFAAVAAVTLISAVFVVILPNILRAALFLVFTFLGVAGLYVLLNAEFLAAMQVLIYIGAITVLIMFGIVLTQQLMGARIRQATQVRMVVIALPVVLIAFAGLAKTFIRPFASAGEHVAAAPAPVDAGTLHQLARMLLQPYVLPFELASLILLAALVGAIVIAKEEKD
ncbi:MAG: NADH-quinone oxidoreductase subunit J [Armatimonadetes bacterium]|nr:NADH-quinone oxidoreductase subunit J [Armatimonadota bacterium]